MKIIQSIKEAGAIVGYMVQDDDFITPVCNRSLYTELFIEPLVASGYTYYNYDANEIEDPDGNPIRNLPSVDVSSLDPVHWASTLNYVSEALSDAYCSKYYKFREESTYQFKTEASYKINTREEFLMYLESIKRLSYNTTFSADNRPINYFVNPEALFTIDELLQDKTLMQYFDVIFKRHRMRNYQSYVSLVKWLNEQGVLNTMNPTEGEFLKAYYAWGPEGLKDKCTNVELKFAVDGNFYFMKDPIGTAGTEDYVVSNRERKPILVDGNSVMHYLNKTTNLANISDKLDFGRSPIMITSNEQIMEVRRAQPNGKRFKVVGNGMVSDVSDRLYISLVSESGYVYTYKVAHNKIKLGLTHNETGHTVLSCNENFVYASAIDNAVIPFNEVHSDDEYYAWNLALLKATSLVKAKTATVPYMSTAEFLIKDGITPISAVNYVAHEVCKKPQYRTNKKYPLSIPGDDLRSALDIYLEDVPEYILEAFMLSIEDLENGIESFIELADVDDLMDRREAMLSNQLLPGMPGYDPTYKDVTTAKGKDDIQRAQAEAYIRKNGGQHDAVDYYTKVKFVSDCLHGVLSVSNFGDGKLDDAGSALMVAAEVMMTAIIATYGSVNSQAIEELSNIENSDMIDIMRVFKTRDNAYKGYMIDYATYRNRRSNETTWIWAYCTKIFREISNAPVDKQRPYLMEIVTIENKKPDLIFRQLMHECVRLSMEKVDFSEKLFGNDGEFEKWSLKKCAMSSIDYMAARLFFFIFAGGVKTAPVNGIYYVDFNLYDDVNITVEIPSEVYDLVKSFNADAHRKYITVYDWCKYEFNAYSKDAQFVMCMVNADIDPWHVKPKKGYSIKTYNLMDNYYDAATLDKANGVGFWQGAKENNAIVTANPIKDVVHISFIPEVTPDDAKFIRQELEYASEPSHMETFLTRDIFEPITAYIKRWTLERNKARELGKELVSIPLKQDIIYRNMASIYCDEMPDVNPIYADALPNNRAFTTDFTVGKVNWSTFANSSTIAIEMKKCNLDSINSANITPIELAKVKDVLTSGTIGEGIYVSGNFINFAVDGTTFRMLATTLSAEDISNLIQSGIITPIGEKKYFMPAVNGNFILEVLI